MFDAKSLLEALVAGQAQRSSATGGGLGDIMGSVLSQMAQGGQPAGQAAGGGLGGALGGLGGALTGALSGGGLGGVLGGLMGQAGGAADQARSMAQNVGGQVAGGLPGNLGGLQDVLGGLLGQATGGVRDAAHDINQSTGAASQLDALVRQFSGGQGSAEMLEKLKGLIGDNQMASGALLGGLGALVLGTRSGRGLAMDAAKLGALALIGGLAYRAYQNYQAGRPVMGGGQVEAAPHGSGFDADVQSDQDAVTYIRAMIAAGMADGQIDAAERSQIFAAFQTQGLGAGAAQFLEAEFRNPASVRALAQAASSPEKASQIYAAARLAIDPDTASEQAFLAELADALGVDADLKAYLDAEADRVKVAA